MFYRNEIRENAGAPPRERYAWHQLEEYLPDGGMWRTPTVGERDALIRAAADHMRDTRAFYASMITAITRWPRSTGQALTTAGLNQRAWLGHAGCYLATGSPEESTRLGWHALDEAEQRAANAAADDAINSWRAANRPARVVLQPALFGAEHA
jgi:hypothetical protein